MKILIIGNPIASGGHVGKKIEHLASMLEKRGHTVESYLTRFAGDGKNRVSTVTADIDRIVVVGGDGTLNEIINGIPDAFSIPLLQLPTGNANLLAHDLILPRKTTHTAKLLESGRVIMADMATMNGLYFIMVAGAGFDARVTEELKKVRKGRVSKMRYIPPILRALKASSPSELDIVVDDKKHARGRMALICNVRQYAGICEIAFDAGVDSRCLDVVVLPAESLLSLCKYFLFAKFGKISQLKGVQYLKGETVKIVSETTIPMQIDGDFVGRHPEVNIELLPKRIPLVVP